MTSVGAPEPAARTLVPVLCCIGDLIEDIVVERTATIATGADTHVVIRRRRGGSAANTAVAAARLGIGVRFFGRVGNDAIGADLIDRLEQEGVEAVVQRSGRTGTILVLIEPGGERSMLGDRGAAAELDRLESPGLRDASWLHVPAYSLVDGPVAAVARGALRSARSQGVPTSIDASSTTVIHALSPAGFMDLMEELQPTVVFANAEEAAALPDLATHRPWEGIAVIKDGPRPGRAVGAHGEVVAQAIAHEIEGVRDTTGAGDAFAAGYIVARMGGGSELEALAAGHDAAASLLQPPVV